MLQSLNKGIGNDTPSVSIMSASFISHCINSGELRPVGGFLNTYVYLSVPEQDADRSIQHPLGNNRNSNQKDGRFNRLTLQQHKRPFLFLKYFSAEKTHRHKCFYPRPLIIII